MPKRYAPSDKYFYSNYNTKLDANAEAMFQQWLMDQTLYAGKDMSKNLQDYDLRGYWQSLGQSGTNASSGHGPDTYKKPNHPTFSNESIYNGATLPGGEPAIGGLWLNNSFSPSSQMMTFTHDPQWLKEYFNKVEPSIQLVLPEKK